MAIFNCYVSSPEGTNWKKGNPSSNTKRSQVGCSRSAFRLTEARCWCGKRYGGNMAWVGKTCDDAVCRWIVVYLFVVVFLHLFNLQVLQLRLWYPCVCRCCADLCWSVAQIYMWCLILAGWLMGTNACLLACLSKLMWMPNQMPPYTIIYQSIFSWAKFGIMKYLDILIRV